jgi:molecular chaperone Hsp33
MDDDLIRPFQIEGQDVRGRLVRMGPTVDTVLTRHAYPPVVAQILGEAMALAAALSAGLKFDGIFTLQVGGNGPLRTLVTDVTTDGSIRGYAGFDAERVAALPSATPSLPQLFGTGHLAFTVDQGENTERYQGIVGLEGATLADCIHHYFRQSEQIPTAVKVACDQVEGRWRAGAIMAQRMPAEGGERGVKIDGLEDDESWRRAVAFLGSATNAELLDPDLSTDRLLYRLFHEDGVRAFDPHALVERCRCSRERVERVLQQLDPEELEDLKVDGQVSVTCEFCSRRYLFDDAAIRALIKP